jgi:arylformamidase
MLEVYPTEWSGAPIDVFIHGGGWRTTRAADYAMLGEIFVRAGAHVVIPDFAPITDHGGDLRPMVEQVRRAVAWVYRNAPRFRGDPDRIYLSGHSSGAHLAGCLVTTNWSAEGLPGDVIKGALLISGMYDLKPVRLSKRSEYVTITDEIEEELSPIRHLDRIVAPLIVAYGTYETPEFQRHGRELSAAVEAAGKPVSSIVAEGYNHFEILETLPSPYGLLGRAALEQMGLGPS